MAEKRIDISEAFDKDGRLYKKTIKEKTNYLDRTEIVYTHLNGDGSLISTEKTIIKYEEVPDVND